MTELTPAASLAWKIGAAEANAARHKFIERGHFLIGLLSLSKVVHDAPPGLELPLKVKQAVARENARVEELLRRLALRSTALRRALRAALGTGTGAADSEARPISRSASLRIAFRRARALAKGAPIDCVHLLAAVLEAPDAPLARALTDTQAQAQDIYKQALASSEAEATNQADVERVLQTELAQLVATLREKHGVSVRITPEAKAFVEPLIPQIVLGIHQAMSLAIASSMWLGVVAAIISVGVALLIPEVALRREHNAQSAALVRTAPLGDPAPPA